MEIRGALQSTYEAVLVSKAQKNWPQRVKKPGKNQIFCNATEIYESIYENFEFIFWLPLNEIMHT